MSVVINGMEMPISCPHCPCSDDESRFCRAANKYIPMLGKPEFCPLVTIEERKKGKWIDMGDFEQCSVCLGTRLKEVQTVYGKAIWLKTDYCPNCGADMRGDEHEDD